MKKYIKYSICYAVAAMLCGVYYREFTKIMGFDGVTMLLKAHPHLFIMGSLLFLIVALFSETRKIEERKTMKAFMRIYNIGLPLTAIMMVIRGTLEVVGSNMSKALDASISGIAGIGHILMGVGFILLLCTLKDSERR